jgi:ferric-dicitrate binding protein FerR (iron transport regulator)
MTDLKTNIGYEELIDYINGNISVEMQKCVEIWLGEDAKNQKMFNELKTYYERKGEFRELNFDTEKALSNINKHHNKKRLFSLYRIAGFVVLLISFSFLFKFMEPNTEIERIIIANQSERVKRVVLPDSSVLWLSDNSQISYNKDFEGKSRKIEMKGHVYFSVTRNIEKPFEVFANDIYIKVLGTSFDVRETHLRTELKVNTGSVLFAEKENKDNQLIIVKDEAASFVLESKNIVQNEIVDPNYKSWFTKVIKFKGDGINNACKYLSRFYGREIKLMNPQDSTKRLTTVIDNLSIEEVEKSIEFALDIELVIE